MSKRIVTEDLIQSFIGSIEDAVRGYNSALEEVASAFSNWEEAGNEIESALSKIEGLEDVEDTDWYSQLSNAGEMARDGERDGADDIYVRTLLNEARAWLESKIVPDEMPAKSWDAPRWKQWMSERGACDRESLLDGWAELETAWCMASWRLGDIEWFMNRLRTEELLTGDAFDAWQQQFQQACKVVTALREASNNDETRTSEGRYGVSLDVIGRLVLRHLRPVLLADVTLEDDAAAVEAA